MVAFLRLIHRVARAFNRIVKITFICFQIRPASARYFLQHGQKRFGLRNHQIDRRANIFLLLDTQLNQIRRIIDASSIRVQQANSACQCAAFPRDAPAHIETSSAGHPRRSKIVSRGHWWFPHRESCPPPATRDNLFAPAAQSREPPAISIKQNNAPTNFAADFHHWSSGCPTACSGFVPDSEPFGAVDCSSR